MCEKMHWTYEQYMSNPPWLIDAISIKMKEDRRYEEYQAKQKPSKT